MGSEYFFCPTVLIQLALAITRDGFDKLAEYSFGFAGFNLTCACVHVTTAALLQAQFSHIGFRATISNGFTNSKYHVLLFQPPHLVNRDIAVGVHGINNKSVCRVNGFLIG